MQRDTRYLVNIDGFLGDFCDFNIQLSSRPAGLSRFARNLDTLKLSSSNNKNIVTLRWTLQKPYDDNIDAFEIYRSQKGARLTMVGNVPAEFNALGVVQSDYAFIDTLSSENNYTYEIIGLLNNGTKEILDRHTTNFYRGDRANGQTLNISLDFKEGTSVQMLLIDKYADKILRQLAIEFRKAQDHSQRIYVGNYIEMGIRNFIVRIVNGKTASVIDHEFVVLDDGGIAKL
jgi:hypothetical protein